MELNLKAAVGERRGGRQKIVDEGGEEEERKQGQG